MIRYALPAAVAVLASGAPFAVEAQTAGQPAPLIQQTNPMMANASVTTGAVAGQPQSGPAAYYVYGQPESDYDAPVTTMPVAVVPVPPSAVWIPGHYNWDPTGQNYVWLAGEFTQPPHPGAQWIPGHWQQMPTAWNWIDGHWN